MNQCFVCVFSNMRRGIPSLMKVYHFDFFFSRLLLSLRRKSFNNSHICVLCVGRDQAIVWSRASRPEKYRCVTVIFISEFSCWVEDLFLSLSLIKTVPRFLFFTWHVWTYRIYFTSYRSLQATGRYHPHIIWTHRYSIPFSDSGTVLHNRFVGCSWRELK